MSSYQPPPITATITMCRRLGLFVRMMDSLLENAKDLHLVTRWIAIDDGSSTADLYEVARRYPFVEVVCNDQKGHPAALNQLFGMVDTAYALHLEDDWEFCHPGDLISNCLHVMRGVPAVGSVGLRNFRFQKEKTADGIEYCLHQPEGCRNGWPGFSLNPGLIDMRKLRQVGPFEDTRCFELHFARRFADAGFCHAYLAPPAGTLWIRHLGVDSAYQINDTNR